MTAQTFSVGTESGRPSMVFKPAPDGSRWAGLAVVAGVLLLDLVLVTWLLRRPVSPFSFVLLLLVLLSAPLLIHLSYRTWGAFNLEYWLDRNAVRIRWADTCMVIPLTAIEQIVGDGELATPFSLRLWPAPFVRSLPAGSEASRALFASRPAESSLWLQTAGMSVAVSPVEPEAFLTALQDYNRLGPSHALSLGSEHVSLCAVSVWEDGLSRWLLSAGGVGVLFLFATLFFAYPGLPDRLIFHYQAAGIPDSIRPKSALFLLPSIGLIAYLVNGLAGLWMACRRQHAGAYLLWGSTLLVQLLSLLALFSLIR